MNVQQIIDRARRLGYVSSNQYNDTQAIEDFNIVRNKLWKIFVQRINEDYFFDVLTTDLIDSQTEYNLFDEANNIEIDKLQEVYVKYDATATEHTKARVVNKNDLTKDLTWYADNQPESDPFYYIADESVFLYPKGNSITGGVKFHATLKLNNLAISATEEEIIIDAPELLAAGLLPFIYQSRGLLNEKNDAKAAYKDSVEEYIELLSDRISSTQEVELPNDTLSYYE